MKVIFFGVHELERAHYENREDCSFDIVLTSWTLNTETASMAEGCDAVSVFIYDDLNEEVLMKLHQMHIELIMIRASGMEHVDLSLAKRLGIVVKNIPAYGADAVSEHALALLLAAARKLKLALANASVHHFGISNLQCDTLMNKTIGIVGAGKIGLSLINLLKGFNARVIVYDINADIKLAKMYGFKYVEKNTLFENADFISLHLPLNTDSKYFIDAAALMKMKSTAVLVNTARGAIVKTKDVLDALDNGVIAAYATDVYENEKGIFHKEETVSIDETLQKLIQNEKVILTPHIGFATAGAISSLAFQTLYQLEQWSMEKEILQIA